MITRKIGKIIRGKATPYQLFSAAILGSVLAFLPAFDQAVGLYILFLGALLVLNANLGVAMLVGLPAKLVALAAVPVSFAIGRGLLDGPLSSLFRWLINAPVTAYLGLEYYVTTGGLVLGLAFGALAGWVLVASLQRLRETFAAQERNSEAFWQMTQKRWVKIACFVFLGGSRGSATYEELTRRRIGLPIRPVGMVVVGLFFTFAIYFQSLLTSSYLANALQATLERTNGATVDVSGLDLDLGQGRLRLEGLAIADREDLGRDAFRATNFEADISTTDLLRKRFTLDRLVISGATSGGTRTVRGKRVGQGPSAPVRKPHVEGEENTYSIDEVFEEGQAWRDRLVTAQRWIERLAPDAAAHRAEAEERSLRERLEERAAKFGYGELTASHLIQGHPRFLISELVIDALEIESMDEVFAVRGHDLTTQPHLVAGSSSIELDSRGGSIHLRLAGDGAQLTLRDLAVDELASSLLVRGERPIAGGTLDVDLDCTWRGGQAGYLDAPLRVTLHDSLLTIPGYSPTVVDRFELPIALRGPLGDLAVSVDDDQLTASLVAAGKAELARRIETKAKAELDLLQTQAEAALGDEIAKHGLDAGALDPEALGLDGVDLEKAADVGEKLETEAGGLLRGLLDRD